MDYTELRKKVINWASERGLLVSPNVKSQMLKVVSEVGELSDAILKDNNHEIKDGIGDVLVTIIILSEMLLLENKIQGSELNCLQIAYDEIKNRKGETKNGTFIKEESITNKQTVGW